MKSRLILLSAALLLAATEVAPAAELCRFRGRSHARLGNLPSTPVVRVPRKHTPTASRVSLHRGTRGKYPYVGKRVTPKRTFWAH